MLALYLKYWALFQVVGHPVGVYFAIICAAVVWFRLDSYFSGHDRPDVPADVAATTTWIAAGAAVAVWWVAVPYVLWLAITLIFTEIVSPALSAVGRTFHWFVIRPLRPTSRKLWRRLRQPRSVKQDPIPRAKVVSE